MNDHLSALLFGVLICFVSANPRCSEYYGYPVQADCTSILTGSTRYANGLKSIDAISTRTHAFILAGIETRPLDVSHVAWGFKREIPEFFAPGG